MGLSRADWVTVAVTLILFGLAYYLSGPRAALICLVAGTVILLVTMFFTREKKSREPSQSSQQTANPVQTQNANPTINVNIGPQPDSMKAPVPASAPQREPNIKFVEARAVGSHQGLEERVIYESPQGLGDFRVSIVCFRNEEIVGQTVQQPTIKAHIIYRDINGGEITDVARGVWLENYGEATVFKTGKKKCLVVFLLSNQGTLMKTWNESYTTEHSWMSSGPLFRIRNEEIPRGIASIEISLLAHGKCLLRAAFNVQADDSAKLPNLVLASVSGI